MTRYLKNMEKEIIIDNQLDEVARIALFIEELGMKKRLPILSVTATLPIKKVKSSFEHLLLPECWLHKL